MTQQALHEAQARLDQLQKQYDAAYTALEAEPSSDLKKERYEDLKISLHTTKDIVNSLAAAAASTSVVSIEHEEAGIIQDVEYTCSENKYEPQQQEEYLQALKAEVRLPSHFSWGQTAKDNPSLLKTTMSTGGAELPFPIRCKTDECIVIRRSATIPEAFITCTIEVKKHVVKQSLRQALTQFVCASLESNLPVISTLTDITKVGVAYYTTGEKTPDGWTIITQRYFATAKAMMQFLAAAMSSIPPDVLRTDTKGHFNLPSMLLEPIRRQLPKPALSQTTTVQRMNLLQQIVDGRMDVADLSDFE
ncbi:TPA: hypothetical protein ACH3X1_006705 [Trebouxia sp. C0004]